MDVLHTLDGSSDVDLVRLEFDTMDAELILNTLIPQGKLTGCFGTMIRKVVFRLIALTGWHYIKGFQGHRVWLVWFRSMIIGDLFGERTRCSKCSSLPENAVILPFQHNVICDGSGWR
ncbi:UNVERIFIED_CONTAM: hypothetical protein Slati_4159400 [Sesamum latifolium]|uniref:Uncharacterized protein n=1 Tax=Sesamum latifolium TaxID=2727402 RepID=A0AAW2TA95_9LAMI